MAEINKIFPQSSLKISNFNMGILCFIDGLLVPSDKYSLTSDRLDIYKQSTDSVNLFYNYNNSQVYEFKTVLNTSGVIIYGKDTKGDTLENVTSDNVMVFVNGILLSKDQYTVISSGEIALSYVVPQSTFQQVLVYVSNNNLIYKKIIYTDNKNLESVDDIIYVYTKSDDQNYKEGGLIKGISYSLNSSIVFINGRKLDNIFIEVRDETFKIKKDIKDTDIVEFYDLSNETESLNFYSTLGYTTFNYKDSNQKKIPLIYNAVFTFNNISKYVIDNIRTGFFIKENLEGGGVAVVVDDTFESPNVKCFISYTTVFQKSSYNSGEYYVEAPDVKSITNYLSSYDQKYRFIPEILEVFQQTLLKEVYDTINRIRDIRNISRVDSYHINKLLKLLGVGIDIKHLSLKKRHELLEELNNWHRIVGTKDSYNMFNILQDNIKIISMEQLFTPSITYTESYTSDLINYDSFTVINGGTGYLPGNRLYTYLTDNTTQELFGFTVSNVDQSTGEILEVICDKSEGKNYPGLRELLTLENQELNLSSTITTDTSLYKYNWSFSGNNSNFSVNQLLHTDDDKYKFIVTEVDNNGAITNYNIINGPQSGNLPLTEENLPLTRVNNSSLVFNVTSTLNSETTILDASSDYGVQKTLALQPGTYKYEISGGGGSGATGDTGHGKNGDLPVGDGNSAEYTTGIFQVTNTSTLSYWIGAGGIGGKAWLENWWKRGYVQSYGGAGYQAGEAGNVWYSGGKHVGKHSQMVVTGGGGGSSRILVSNIIDKTAKGGQGGGWVTSGGLGGGGGVSGSGAAGGLSANHFNDFWGRNGSNGWIKIKKLTYDYSHNISGTGQNITVGDKLVTDNNEFVITVKAIDGNVVTDYECVPANNLFNYNKSFSLGVINNINLNLNINSTSTTYHYTFSNLNGLVNYLYNNQHITATLNDEFLQLHPEYASFTLDGTVVKNNVTGEISVNWTYPDMHIPEFNNTLLDIDVPTGSGIVKVAPNISTLVDRKGEREYVDFYRMEEIGGHRKHEYVIDTIKYGEISEPTLENIEYGTIESSDEVKESFAYGQITDKVDGKWVEWIEWDEGRRNPIYYPTNHVDIEIKIESSEDEEDVRSRFIDQFYDLASTVLYIHRLTAVYFFGNGAQSSSDGPTSIDKTPVFFGIKEGPVVTYQTITLTSDPKRQINTYNLNKF